MVLNIVLFPNPLACATALTVLEVIERDKICETVLSRSIMLKEMLMHELGNHPNVRSIRGVGYMLGIELDKAAQDIKPIGLEQGILLNVTAESVIRLLPALIISESEIETLVKRLVNCINAWAALVR